MTTDIQILEMFEVQPKQMTILTIIRPVLQLLNIATDLHSWNSRL